MCAAAEGQPVAEGRVDCRRVFHRRDDEGAKDAAPTEGDEQPKERSAEPTDVTKTVREFFDDRGFTYIPFLGAAAPRGGGPRGRTHPPRRALAPCRRQS